LTIKSSVDYGISKAPFRYVNPMAWLRDGALLGVWMVQQRSSDQPGGLQ
jgi:hypothetical protein